MTKYQLLDALLHILFFMMGAGIGSFLNVVIYRVPLGLSVNEPRRSFCPSCKKQIPWHQNIPLVSWLLLRGKCANCKSSIAARYIFVELLVGVLFYAIFRYFGGDWADISIWGPRVLCLWVFVSLLVAGTFIDIEHYLLPDQITITGTIAGLLAATWVPDLVRATGHGWGGLMALAGAALGFFLLWGIVELGKIAFGRKKFAFPQPVKWEVA
ncbi:MAG: prepilin peptidase, partial [Verrucomicrobiales bacterium]|nr:prepilin peptidase [Verrucomicrobiales bacterium]